jgi:hypothetical protein
MYPSIKPGSIVFIEPAPMFHLFEYGDIVAWKLEKGFIVHRIIRKFEKIKSYFL